MSASRAAGTGTFLPKYPGPLLSLLFGGSSWAYRTRTRGLDSIVKWATDPVTVRTRVHADSVYQVPSEGGREDAGGGVCMDGQEKTK